MGGGDGLLRTIPDVQHVSLSPGGLALSWYSCLPFGSHKSSVAYLKISN